MSKQLQDVISIIIPVYQVENKYFIECLNSIKKQTYKNIQVIIVNDGMTEENIKTAKTFEQQNRNVSIIGYKNEGVSSARNKGIDFAVGQWIVFLDADDYLEPDFCKIMSDLAKKHKSDCVQCDFNKIYEDKIEKINNNNKIINYNNSEFLYKVLNVKDSFCFVHTKLWKAETIKKYLVYFDKNIKVAEDALFCTKMCKYMKKITYIGKSLYNYRFSSNSIAIKYDEQYVDKYLMSMKEVKKYILNNYKLEKEVRQNLYNFIVYHLLLICENYCFNSENNKTKRQKTENLKEICNIPEFQQAIKYSNYKDLSVTRKITLFTLKFKLYFLTEIMCNMG